MTIHLIAAIAENGVIGFKGHMPWDLPDDLQHFKNLTMGHTIIMGRRTWESIRRALPGRQNIVVSRTMQAADGCQIARSLPEALALAVNEQVYIIGGAMLYAEALPLAQQLDLTLVHATPEGDTFFPDVDWQQFTEIVREPHDGQPAYTFVTYQRNG